MIPDWLARIVCPKQVDDVCPFRVSDIVSRLDRIEADGVRREQTINDMAKALHDHMRQETADFGSVLLEVREMVQALRHG